ncbi:hypothetical protein K491DRAFT_723059 [Lophiostoma macrostomum CBS 122681]|uniref:DUF7053 domain-containing protein n=1 Tax=Lophiostoma macrostomum CBS 122681 TaxID=1314788 RepID=A0A6A6SJU4_9PLEO|nr:hypothetical protein K491DRAFT_723059 [Lophiostoma macrostomum CBS 122681]
MMSKKANYTQITPIPSFIPRQLAIDILHSHGEIIELNPLVLGFEAIKAPRDAPADEFYATWYEIEQRIQYIPGMRKLGSGKIKFKGCFHDMPWGVQTHTYAPAGVDLRNKWQIAGNQPGEPPETRELGIGAPPEGLYLREDVAIKCNMTMINFVKKEMKAASEKMVERLIKKAELLDAGALHAMMENGKLKTINPANRASAQPGPRSPQPSPTMPYDLPMSPTRQSTFPQQMGGQQHYPPPNHAQGQNNIVMELPGDYYHPQSSPNHLHPDAHRFSTASELSNHSPNPSDGRWSQVSNDYQSSISSRPSSYAASDGMRSPGIDQKGFAAELPTMEETREEYEDTRRKLEGESYPQDRKYEYNPQDTKYRYNPQDYANMQHSTPPQYSQHNQHGR